MSRAIKKMLNSCDIADGMLLSGYASGGALNYVNQFSGQRISTISGPAYTVEFAPKDDPRPAVTYHYIDSVPSDSIMLIATSIESQLPYSPFTTIKQSLYGGLMSRRAQYLGCKGTVVLGLIRDIEEHTSLDYSVFAYGTNPCAANKAAKVVSVNQPLHVERNKVVNPGDIVYADQNGVTIVPKNEHESVIKFSELRAKANELTSEDLSQGKECKSSQNSRRKEYA